jgi:hypothetical protein
MKNLIAISGLLLIVSISCGGGEKINTNSNSSDSKEKLEKEKQLKLEKQKLDSINKVLSTIQVRIFNHTPLYFDSEGFCLNESMGKRVKIYEVEDFNNSKSYNCNDGNYIQKLSVEGTFKGINILFLDDKNKVLKEYKNYNLEESVNYSCLNREQTYSGLVNEIKDEFFEDWFEKASKIEMSYGDSIFYTANWKSKGYFVQ